MLFPRTNKLQSSGWWWCSSKMAEKPFFLEINSFKATFLQHFKCVSTYFFGHRFLRDVSDRFAILGHQITRCELHFESFRRATKFQVRIWPGGSHTGEQRWIFQTEELCIKMLSTFTSTCVCESTFSVIKQVGSNYGSTMADKTLKKCLLLATVNVIIDMQAIIA